MARPIRSMAPPLPAAQARHLAQRLMDGQLALFVGAGLSHLARTASGRRLPLWAELAQQVAERCHEDPVCYRDVLDLFDAIAFGQERGTLERAVRELLDDREFEPSPAHRVMAPLPWAAVLSTNYDGLLALLLTLAVLFYKSRRRLPHDRWEFYDVAEQVLRDSWVQHRLHHAEGQLPRSYLPELLERLALLGMVGGKVAFTREELERECRALLVARDYGGAERDRECALFVRAAEDLIGVLVAQGPGAFGFLHLTFQEFLAARALRHRSAEVAGLLARFWDHPDWEEVWRLYALAIEADAARYAELIHETLRHPHPLDTRLQRHRLACLGLIGVGSARLPDEAEEVVQWAVAAIREGPAGLHDQVLTRLGPWERSPLPASLLAALLAEARGKPLRGPAVRALWVAARDGGRGERAAGVADAARRSGRCSAGISGGCAAGRGE